MIRNLDWAAMIHQLNNHGLTQAKISSVTGISTSTLSAVKLESIAPTKGWNEAVELLDLYLKKIGLPPPRVGDYVEIK